MQHRIIFDCERMKYENTGLYHYCLNLGIHLTRQINPVVEGLSFFSPSNSVKLFDKNSAHIIQHGYHKFRMPALDEYNIWHATYQDSYYLPFRNKKIKVVLSIHDLNFLYDETKSKLKKQRCLQRLQKLINRADTLICVSEFSKNDVLFYCDVKNKPIFVIKNGTNTLAKPELLKKSYMPSLPFIFSLGTVVPKKNFHSLLPLLENEQQMELVIAGRIDDVAYYQSILDTAANMGISKKLKMIGPITEAEKSWYYNNCEAFVFPSIAEGFGLPVTEAMSVGKPLFLSGLTALPEIGGDAAFYFKNFGPSHMQETFVAGMKQYKLVNMQHDIIKKGKEYSWENAAQEYWKIYRSLY